MSWETFNEEGFRTLHDVQSFRGVRNPARSQNARFSLAHRLAATFPGAGNGMSAMRVLRSASAARVGRSRRAHGRVQMSLYATRYTAQIIVTGYTRRVARLT